MLQNGNFPQFKNAYEVQRYFAINSNHKDYLEKIRWDSEPRCPHCESKNHEFKKTRKTYLCKDCGRTYNVLTNTIFQNSKELHKFFTMIAMSVRENFTSASYQSVCGLTQPNAWYMQTKFRLALENDLSCEKMTGTVEIDETFMGGNPQRNLKLTRDIRVIKLLYESYEEEVQKLKPIQLKPDLKRGPGRPKGSGKPKPTLKRPGFGHKTAILGLRERETGRCIYIPLGNGKAAAKIENILPHLQRFIDVNAIVISDDAKYYKKLKEHFPNHRTIRHKMTRKKTDEEIAIEKAAGKKRINKRVDIYDKTTDSTLKLYSRWAKVNGKDVLITTNNIEGRWAHLKLDYNLRLSYTREHLPGYLAEFAWRSKKDCGKRTFDALFRDLLRKCCNFYISKEELQQFKYIRIPNLVYEGHWIRKRVNRDFGLSSDFNAMLVPYVTPQSNPNYFERFICRAA